MSARPDAPMKGHGGELAVAALQGFGVDTMFTLNGGHVWPLYDAAIKADMRILDTRHEQTATWAAEAYAKLTRRPGLAVLTAGPGVTNGVSAITSAHFNGSPVVVLGGRAPEARWGQGSLQELDHVPILASITKFAATAADTGTIASTVIAAATQAGTPHRGPVFVDIAMDALFSPGEAVVAAPDGTAAFEPDPDAVSAAAQALASAERPAIIAGSDVWWAGAEDGLRAAAEALRVPCFFNGMGRGCLPPDHPLSFSLARGVLRSGADVVAVVGAPLDFRLGFGRFGAARVIHVADDPAGVARHVPDLLGVAGDLRTVLGAWAAWDGTRRDHEAWIDKLRSFESSAAAEVSSALSAAGEPIKPTRVMGELRRRLDAGAVIICDGGDFASYAGKYLEVSAPGLWLDTGPYGCLGNGPGYAIAARLAKPDAQIVAVLGDGAIGFSLCDIDTMVRHRLPAVLLVGNNGIWGLEKHPMRAIYGYDVACDLQPGCRYDLVAQALGAGGELVTDPDQIGPALDRAFASDLPYLLNVLTDPEDQYPRSSNLA